MNKYIVLHVVQKGQEFNGEDAPRTGWAWTLVHDWPPQRDLLHGDGPFESYQQAYTDASDENREQEYGCSEPFCINTTQCGHKELNELMNTRRLETRL